MHANTKETVASTFDRKLHSDFAYLESTEGDQLQKLEISDTLRPGSRRGILTVSLHEVSGFRCPICNVRPIVRGR